MDNETPINYLAVTTTMSPIHPIIEITISRYTGSWYYRAIKTDGTASKWKYTMPKVILSSYKVVSTIPAKQQVS